LKQRQARKLYKRVCWNDDEFPNTLATASYLTENGKWRILSYHPSIPISEDLTILSDPSLMGFYEKNREISVFEDYCA